MMSSSPPLKTASLVFIRARATNFGLFARALDPPVSRPAGTRPAAAEITPSLFEAEADVGSLQAKSPKAAARQKALGDVLQVVQLPSADSSFLFDFGRLAAKLLVQEVDVTSKISV